MTQSDFICELNSRLSGLPEEDINKSIDYYCELINDYIEDGKSEEEAVAALGSIDDIVNQIYTDTPLMKLVKSKVKPNRAFRTWEIILLILGSPIWLSIVLAFAACVLAICISFWAVIVSLFATSFALAVSVVAIVIASFVLLFSKSFAQFAIFLGCAFVICGVCILLFIASKYLVKCAILMVKGFFRLLKKSFVKKEEK